jgi:hypothetical protein
MSCRDYRAADSLLHLGPRYRGTEPSLVPQAGAPAAEADQLTRKQCAQPRVGHSDRHDERAHSPELPEVQRSLVHRVELVTPNEGVVMAAKEHARAGWRERGKEAKRNNAARTGDTPEKQRDRSHEPARDSRQTTDQAATSGGIVSGGFGGA